MSELLAAAACTPARLSDLGTLLQVLGQFLSLSLFSRKHSGVGTRRRANARLIAHP